MIVIIIAHERLIVNRVSNYYCLALDAICLEIKKLTHRDIFFRCARCWRIRLVITLCKSRRTRCANICTSHFAVVRAAMRSSAVVPVARAAAGRRSTLARHLSQWWCKVHRPARSCITRSRSILISPRIRTPPRCCRITQVTPRWSQRARPLPPPAPCPRVCPASPPATPR